MLTAVMDKEKEAVRYRRFREQYHLLFDPQQEEALRKSEGTVLLLAVPGSGKTTTLIGKLGYMVHCLGVSPEEILAITYTTAAAAHMREEYKVRFGEETGNRISFLTINSLCWRIVLRYYRAKGREIGVLDEKTQRKWVRELLKEIRQDPFPPEADILNAQTTISLVKNRMMRPEEIREKDWETEGFPELFERYQSTLVKHRLADYDDQMIFALKILRSSPELLEAYRRRFTVICVDEAQDTSLLQHCILDLLSRGSRNLFLVGDEDQSIYGYRGACPEELLNIRERWPDAKVLKLETNYRSHSEITEKAQTFVEKNQGRYSKTMHAARGSGGVLRVIGVKSRGAQLKEIAPFVKGAGSAAILYRNNDSAVVLIDYLERNRIPWTMNRTKDTFFTNRVVTDLRTFFEFALDPDNPELFLKCVTKVSLYFKTERAKAAVQHFRTSRHSLLDEFILQNQYQKGTPKYQIDQSVKNAGKFKSVFRRIPSMKPADAIALIGSLGYQKYMKDCGLSTVPMENLQMIAGSTASPKEFLKRLETLKGLLEEDKSSGRGVILSTIHSAKGMEFDRVLLFDVIDGILPNCRASEKPALYQEERRLFYVALTRAKNELVLLSVKNKEKSFPNEIAAGLKREKTSRTSAGEMKKEAPGTKKKRRKKIKIRRLRDLAAKAEEGQYLIVEDVRSGDTFQIRIEKKTEDAAEAYAWRITDGKAAELCTKEVLARQDEKTWRLISEISAEETGR